jgi:peptidoglycan-associated lipoprotein
MLTLRTALIAAVVVTLSACASGNKDKIDARNTGAGSSTTGTMPYTGTAPQPLGGNTAPQQTQSELAGRMTQNVVYFEFDSAEISADGLKVVEVYGSYLAANPSMKVRLEGHTDERGTREYNIGLGERRAVSVEQALLRAGATPSQVSVVSYGEERPVAPGSGESDWAQNRRVEIVRL